MQFIHTADFHLKKSFNNINFDRNTRREDLWLTFERIVKDASNVDFLVIAGDIFEREYFTISDFKRLFSTLDSIDTDVIIAFGNHDYINDTEIFELLKIPPNVHIFTDKISYFEFNDVRFYGFSWNSDDDPEIELKFDLDSSFTNILVMHASFGSIDKYYSFNEEDVEDFSYVALGHIHKNMMLGKNSYYPGSPEGLSFAETGERTYNLVTIEDKNIFVEKVPCNTRLVVNTEVDVTDLEIFEIIEQIESFSPQDVIRISLVGRTNNPSFILSTLKERFKEILFVDEMETVLNLEEISTLNENNVLGKFLKKLEGEDELTKRAIEIGIELLGDMR